MNEEEKCIILLSNNFHLLIWASKEIRSYDLERVGCKQARWPACAIDQSSSEHLLCREVNNYRRASDSAMINADGEGEKRPKLD